MTRIVREAALDLVEGIYRPKVGTHVSGALNVAADHLSRLFEPNSVHTFPKYFADVQESTRHPAIGSSSESMIYQTPLRRCSSVGVGICRPIIAIDSQLRRNN